MSTGASALPTPRFRRFGELDFKITDAV